MKNIILSVLCVSTLLFSMSSLIASSWSAPSSLTNNTSTGEYAVSPEVQTAIAFTNDIEGAAYFFNTLREHHKQGLSEPAATTLEKRFISSSGDYIPLIYTHQLSSNRIASLKLEQERLKA